MKAILVIGLILLPFLALAAESGPLTLETLVQRITGHIPHHVQFIEDKRKAMVRA
jgi:hypothetical protein